MKSDPNKQQKMGQQDIVIIGGGIVGSVTAALLAEAGRDVLVIDRTGICEETSSGNAAALAFSEILPLASKGVMRKVPGWLMDPLGPFSIRPSYFPKMVPWLYQFWRASSAEALEKTAVTQANIMRLAASEMLALIDRAELRDRLQENGNLELYESEAELNCQAGTFARRLALRMSMSMAQGWLNCSRASARASWPEPSCRAGKMSATRNCSVRLSGPMRSALAHAS
jgi:D-amino-acid dehydrogenase